MKDGQNAVNIIIFEDDKRFAELLEEQVNSQGYQVVLKTDNIKLLRNHLLVTDVAEVYLLDILIGDSPEGIEAFQIILQSPKNHQCIFLTDYLNYILNNPQIKINAFSFINKQALGELPFTLEQANAQIKNDNLLIIHSKFNRISISFEGIYYLESLDDKIIIYHEEGIFTTRERLGALKMKLIGNFIQCHRSYIVNQNQILEYDISRHMILLKNGYQCPYVQKRMGR